MHLQRRRNATISSSSASGSWTSCLISEPWSITDPFTQIWSEQGSPYFRKGLRRPASMEVAAWQAELYDKSKFKDWLKKTTEGRFPIGDWLVEFLDVANLASMATGTKAATLVNGAIKKAVFKATAGGVTYSGLKTIEGIESPDHTDTPFDAPKVNTAYEIGKRLFKDMLLKSIIKHMPKK